MLREDHGIISLSLVCRKIVNIDSLPGLGWAGLGWAGLGTHLGHPGRSSTAVGQFEHSDTVHWLL